MESQPPASSLPAPDAQLVAARLRELFRETPVEQLDSAMATMSPAMASEGDVLLSEGEVADRLLVLCEGRVRIYARTAEGSLCGLATVSEPGTLLGEQGLLVDRQFRNATAIALVPSRVAVMPGDVFRALVARDAAARDALAAAGSGQSDTKLRLLARELADLFGSEPARPPRSRQLPAGAVLFRAGDPAVEAYFILSGEIGLSQPGAAAPHEIVGAGLLLGERAVLEGRARELQAVAQAPTEVLVVEPAVLAAAQQEGGPLRTILRGLAYVHAMPQFGTAYRYLGHLHGEACVVTDYQQLNGLRVRVRHFPRQLRTEAARIDSDAQGGAPAASPDGETSLMLGASGVLLGLAAPQGWPRLSEAMGLLLRGGTLEPWQVAAFRSSGDLLIEPAALRASGGVDIVCGCTNTTSSSLRTAAQRVDNVEDLQRITGAGTVCGGCRGRLPAFLGQGDVVLCRLATRPLAAGSVVATLTPVGPGPLAPARPGQHVRIEAMLDGRWVGRPYTLVGLSPSGYELGVKVEEGGLFSNWIREAPQGSLVRVGRPEGDLCPAAADPRLLVYVVAGIGVTPAMAAVRHLGGRRLQVVYSYRTEAAAAYLTELRAAASAGRLTLLEHDTAGGSRLGPEALASALEGLGPCEVVVCGPSGFNRAMLAALRGVPGVSAVAESFDHPQRGEGALLEPGAWRRKDFQPRCPAGPPVECPTPLSVAEQADQFVREFHQESRPGVAPDARLGEVRAALAATGAWEKTFDELGFAARCAWRNAERCVGRLYWNGLHLRDCRSLTDPDAMAEALWEHLRFAFNGGDLRPAITVFDPGTPARPGPRLWNPQLMRYAGYRLRSGRQVGDPAQNELTQRILALGWRPPGTDFDLLPIVIEAPGHEPRLYELPPDCRWEVPLRHAQHPWMASMNLKWYAVPAVSDMALDAGGVLYRMVAFNGWYLNTEIAARNLTDTNRYNLLPAVAEAMGLDIRDDRTLWRDKALIVLNEAVLQSFDRMGVRMADHHHVGHEFLEFCRNEQRAGREPQGNWAWLVPPVSSSLSVLYQEPFEERTIKPCYVYQDPVWKGRPMPGRGPSDAAAAGGASRCPFH